MKSMQLFILPILVLLTCLHALSSVADESISAQTTNDTPEFRLNEAAHMGDLAETLRLLNNGAKIDTVVSGHTPLATAVLFLKMPVIELLLKRGARLDVVGQTIPPLVAAAGGASTSGPLVTLLLEHGANPNAVDFQGRTALHETAKYGYLTIAEILLAAGADPFIKDKKLKTPLDDAQKISPFIAQRLTDYQDVFKETQNNPTQATLEKAVRGGFAPFVKQLIQKIRQTPEQISTLGKIAHEELQKAPQTAKYAGIWADLQQQYLDTKTSAFLVIGRLLRDYARNLRVLPVEKTDESPGLPSDVVRSIADYTTT